MLLNSPRPPFISPDPLYKACIPPLKAGTLLLSCPRPPLISLDPLYKACIPPLKAGTLLLSCPRPPLISLDPLFNLLIPEFKPAILSDNDFNPAPKESLVFSLSPASKEFRPPLILFTATPASFTLSVKATVPVANFLTSPVYPLTTPLSFPSLLPNSSVPACNSCIFFGVSLVSCLKACIFTSASLIFGSFANSGFN